MATTKSGREPTVLFDATILSTDTRTRGVGRYVVDLVTEMGRLGADEGVRLRYLTRIERTGATTIVDDADDAVERLLATPELDYYDWAYRLRLGSWLASRRAGADILHTPHTFATPLFDPKAVRLVNCHDLVPLRFPEHYVNYKDGFRVGRKLLDTRRTRRADHIIAISEATATDLESLLDVPREKITVIHMGLTAANWPSERGDDDAERVAGVGIAGPYVLYVGAADWRKNPEGMLRAVARARDRGHDVELVWAGRLSEKSRATLEGDAARLGARLRLVGYVDDATLQALYRQAIATLFCSYCEGFGYPIIEAMALESPVITSDCSALCEVAGDAALLVDPARPDQIADAIVRLLEDEGARDALRERGRVRAKTFTCERMARETLQLYRRLAAR